MDKCQHLTLESKIHFAFSNGTALPSKGGVAVRRATSEGSQTSSAGPY